MRRAGKAADVIESAASDGVRWLTLERPERRNALTRSGMEDLATAIERAEEAVLCLQGAGAAFCAGADLDVVDALVGDTAADFAGLGQDVARALASYDGATVAAIDGATRGGGLELALACDVRACTPASSFAATGVTIGLLGAWGGTVRLPEVVGAGEAADLALSGRVVDAEQALRTGLVSRVVEEPDAVAREIADNDPAAIRAVADRLRDDAPVETREQRERQAFAALVRRRKG